MRLRRMLATAVIVPATAFACLAGYVTYLDHFSGKVSICRGTVANGSLTGGRRLPLSDANYRSYSTLLFLAGRTFVHGTVRDALHQSYTALAKTNPDLRFVYGETGWPWGGSFAPHRTHRNGTAVDFFVPVRDLAGNVSQLPMHPLNRYGYDVNFDRKGQTGSYRIDFDAMAQHLLALDRAAREHGIGIQRVIFDIDLQPLLFATRHGAEVRRRLNFNKAQAWVRHDQHYHVDFDLPCRP